MRLSKKEFIEYVNKYKSMLKEESDLIDILNVNPEWKPGEWLNNYYDLLSHLCELPKDPIYGTDLDWFFYETDFGKNKDFRVIINGTKRWDIKDAGTLYDYLTYTKEHPF